ncbi:MAG TPA: hypothetical protein VM347_26090 [Nonomuraea sp.]|nr:hypothetical protein [Nonomuraea sp.]
MLVSGLTCVLGFLLGFFTGIGAEETTASSTAAPQMTMTIEGSTPPADQRTAPSEPGSTASSPAGPGPTASAPVGSSAPPGGLAATRTLIVGVDIQPGNYRTTGPVAGAPQCYWARMKSTSAQISDVISAGMPAGPATVTILATDKAFQTAGCAEWSKA